MFRFAPVSAQDRAVRRSAPSARTRVAAIAACLCAMIAIPGVRFSQAQAEADADAEACVENLMTTYSSKVSWEWAAEAPTDAVVPLRHYLMSARDMLPADRVCPSGYRYLLAPVGYSPVCTSGLEGHTIGESRLRTMEPVVRELLARGHGPGDSPAPLLEEIVLDRNVDPAIRVRAVALLAGMDPEVDTALKPVWKGFTVPYSEKDSDSAPSDEITSAVAEAAAGAVRQGDSVRIAHWTLRSLSDWPGNLEEAAFACLNRPDSDFDSPEQAVLARAQVCGVFGSCGCQLRPQGAVVELLLRYLPDSVDETEEMRPEESEHADFLSLRRRIVGALDAVEEPDSRIARALVEAWNPGDRYEVRRTITQLIRFHDTAGEFAKHELPQPAEVTAAEE